MRKCFAGPGRAGCAPDLPRSIRRRFLALGGQRRVGQTSHGAACFARLAPKMGDLPDAPEGTRSIFISMKKLETYGLKTGDGVQDLVDSKVLSREALLEEIQKLGFMSDFHEAKADIDAYPDAELLLVRDVGQKHGNDWLLCTTAEAKARFLDAAEAERAAAEAAEREALEAEAARRAAEEAKRSIVYVDGPTIANSWVSEHSEETAADIQKLNVRPRRPLLGFSVTCPRGLVERPLGLQQRNVEGVLEYRTHKVPAEDFVAVRLAEIGVQAAPRFSDSDTQTNWQRPVNKATETRSSEAATREPAGARDAPSADDILAFLSRTAPLAEEALLQNETVNVFSDAFAHVQREEEASLGAKGENDLKELRTFTDLRFSKNNVLSAIDWLPQSRTTLAVSVIRDLGFDARVAVAGQVERAYILLWSFEDLIHPQLKLRAPKEVMCFRFCETRPAVVAAGLLNGQVALWDTTASMELLRQRRQKGHSHQRNGAAEDLGDGELPPLEPIAVSHIEASHKRMVSDLIWLPWNTQVNSRGQLVDKENLTPGVSHQFVTVAGDGHLLIWDTRYEGIVNGEFPFLARPKGMKEVHGDREKDSENKEATPWLPLFKIQLKRIDGVGELTLCRVCLAGLPLAPGGDGSRSGFFCATEEGDIVFADWRAKQCQGASNDDDEEVRCFGDGTGGTVAAGVATDLSNHPLPRSFCRMKHTEHSTASSGWHATIPGPACPCSAALSSVMCSFPSEIGPSSFGGPTVRSPSFHRQFRTHTSPAGGGPRRGPACSSLPGSMAP